ncbi:MAG: M14 family metallopeptidase [Bacteroidota bacterium]
MKYAIAALLVLISLSVADAGEWDTHYEKSGFVATPTYEQTLEYSKKLAAASEKLQYMSFGQSSLGYDLPLLIYSPKGKFTPAENKDNTIILMQGCIHAGESDGKDAGLMLLRDMLIRDKYNDIADNLTILFIPILNVDGHLRFGPYNRINQNGPVEMGWRTNAQNLNLNRDFLKADSPAIRAWLKLFNEWNPDFFLDLHTTNGADYQYTVTYSMETKGNMPEALKKWQEDVYIGRLEKDMLEKGYELFPYVAFRNWHDPRSGLRTWVAPPRLSHGYTALRNRPGILVETHMLKPYKDRVQGTYELLISTMEILHEEGKNLRKLITEADRFTESMSFRENHFVIDYRLSDIDSIIVEFKGVDYEAIESDLTGGIWYQYSDVPAVFEVPFYNKPVPSDSAIIPAAYAIPPQYAEVIERIKAHGIEYSILKENTELEVDSYMFDNVEFRNSPSEGRFTVNADRKPHKEMRTLVKGTIIIRADQPLIKVAAHILEPGAMDSYLWWGFFNAIFEQKEYGESYVLEKTARQMLKENNEIAEEFNEKMKNDEDFASKPRQILNWFYMKSKYWDKQMNNYPVSKIRDLNEIEHLLEEK